MNEYILKNGMKVIYKKATSELTSISISLDAGAAVEEEKLGLAHATEHMIYKGTKKRSEEEINKELSSVFGFQNAMTNYPYVIYYGTLLSEDFERGIEIFSDILINTTLSESGFNEEMEVIKEELKEWDEDLEQFCEDKLFLNAFHNRRIKYPIIGKEETIESITLEDIRGFYNKYYFPGNTTIALVSSLDFEEVKELIEKYFGAWENSNENIKANPIYEIGTGSKYTDFKAGVNTCKVKMIFPIDSLDNDEIKALRIFNEYFGESVNSVLYDILRTKNGLIYDVITKIAYEKHIKLYSITFSTSKENLDKALTLINNSIRGIEDIKEKLDLEEIKKYIKTLKLKRLFREEQSIILAKELSTYNTMFGDYKVYSEEFDDLEDISINEIISTAKKVFITPSIEIIANEE